jgi:hypothetical protein
MIGMAIQILWLLIGVVILGGIIWLALYVVRTILGIAIPPRIEQAVWLIFLLLILIAVLTLLAGGSIGGYHLGKIGSILTSAMAWAATLSASVLVSVIMIGRF